MLTDIVINLRKKLKLEVPSANTYVMSNFEVNYDSTLESGTPKFSGLSVNGSQLLKRIYEFDSISEGETIIPHGLEYIWFVTDLSMVLYNSELEAWVNNAMATVEYGIYPSMDDTNLIINALQPINTSVIFTIEYAYD